MVFLPSFLAWDNAIAPNGATEWIKIISAFWTIALISFGAALTGG